MAVRCWLCYKHNFQEHPVACGRCESAHCSTDCRDADAFVHELLCPMSPTKDHPAIKDVPGSAANAIRGIWFRTEKEYPEWISIPCSISKSGDVKPSQERLNSLVGKRYGSSMIPRPSMSDG